MALLPDSTAALTATRPAAAHPLGNFTVNRFARLEVEAERIPHRLRARHGRGPTFPGDGRT
ncbi:MAG: hypothetical protein U0531_11230 [Dehalococcoidia bacterium]